MASKYLIGFRFVCDRPVYDWFYFGKCRKYAAFNIYLRILTIGGGKMFNFAEK